MDLQATADDAGLRLDVWLSKRLPDVSRSRVQSLIKSGHITAAGQPVTAHAKVTAQTRVSVEIPAAVPVAAAAEDLPLAILYEDSDIVVLNKQAGIVVHPAAGHAAGTLVNALLHHCQDLAGVGGERRPGIVHRLDKDTTGVMVVAKNDRAMAGLTAQFKQTRVQKVYTALVEGLPRPAMGTIDTLIGRSPHDRKKMSARAPVGRQARSHYQVVEVLGDVCRVKVRIETGRTHQIRVHMAHIGHPVVGDRQYGGRHRRAALPVAVSRQMLHAEQLAFCHPVSGAPLTFTAPLPADMAELLQALRAISARPGSLDKGRPMAENPPPC